MHEGKHDTTKTLEPNGEDCSQCGASNAGAIVDGEVLCGECAHDAEVDGTDVEREVVLLDELGTPAGIVEDVTDARDLLDDRAHLEAYVADIPRLAEGSQ